MALGEEWEQLLAGHAAAINGTSGGGAGQLSAEDEALAKQLSQIAGIPLEQARIQVQTMAAPEQMDAQDELDAILTQAAVEVSGLNLYQYGGDSPLPHWVPDSIKKYASRPAGQNLTGVYDPYQGFLETQGDERVYMGKTKRKVQGAGRDEENPDYVDPGLESKLYGQAFESDPSSKEKTRKGRRRGDRTLTYQQAVDLPYAWEDDEVSANMRRFRQAGWNVTNFDELVDAWGSLVARASKTYTMSQGNRKVTPWDVLEMSKREAQAAGNYTDFESGTQTQTATSVAEISEGAAWKTLQATLSTLLGRDPSDRELRDYAYRMNSLAARNPTVTETTTTYEAGRPVSQNSSTSGGFDASDMAQAAYEEAQDDPEYAKVQGGTTYFNALVSALGAVGDI